MLIIIELMLYLYVFSYYDCSPWIVALTIATMETMFNLFFRTTSLMDLLQEQSYPVKYFISIVGLHLIAGWIIFGVLSLYRLE